MSRCEVRVAVSAPRVFEPDLPDAGEESGEFLCLVFSESAAGTRTTAPETAGACLCWQCRGWRLVLRGGRLGTE
jgi:hypothetical protein